MATTTLYVFCYLPGLLDAVPAGRFEFDAVAGVGVFAYGRRYLQRATAMSLDCVALPLGGEVLPVTINGGLYGAFRDASPDYWGRLVVASGLKCPVEALSEIDYLVRANATRVGNLDFRPSLEAPEPSLAPPQFQDLADLLEAADSLADGRYVDEPLRVMLEQGSSIGGARPKCTIELDGELWLAKFPARNDQLSIPRLEFGIMELASLCGLNVPETRLETIGQRQVFLTRRFDREAVAGGWSRCGYLSALSLAEWDERDRDKWSYRTVAERIRRYAIRPQANLRELFLRIAFNILVRNTDDHPRNHGFLIRQEGLSLSPLFDVVPSLARRGVSTEFFLAMSVGSKGRLAALENLCGASAAFNLQPAKAKVLVEEMKDRVVTSWRAILSNVGFANHELDILAPSFDRHQ
ncbi:MAG: HipA domain-containing protein [Candidatus Eisenbacteria sp.]|nr:HipA domain-containing protein [Candidatus Eisenbacteria bacterium]